MGRYGGALAGVRPDDLAAHVIAKAVERTGIDPTAVCDVYLGAANQAGEDNRDAARMAALLAGLPHGRPGGHRQPALRLGPGGGQPGLAGTAPRRGGPVPGGGRRVDEPGPMGRPKAGCRAAARAADDARHIARLAADQPADGRALLDRVDGRDRRERGGALRDRPRGAGQVRAPEPHPRGGSDARGAVRRRARAGRGPITQRSERPGRWSTSTKDRAPTPRSRSLPACAPRFARAAR